MVLSRYLIKRFLSLFVLSVGAFFGLVLTTRFHEIASFAAFGAGVKEIVFFLLLQFPYILPAVIPIGALLAAYILMQEMSRRFELVSLRASGLSFWMILTPMLQTALVLSVLNFILVSDVATSCHLQARLMEREFKGVNPLVLLKHPELIRMKGVEVATLGELKAGVQASQLVVAVPHPKKRRLFLFFAEELKKEKDTIFGKEVTFLSCGGKGGYPELFMDHSKTLQTQQESFSRIFKGESGKVSIDYLRTPLLLNRLSLPTHEVKQQNKMWSELVRRISMGLEPFTLTFLGLAFGVTVGRKQKGLFVMIGLALLNLTAIFLGKTFYKDFVLSASIYLLPHPLLIMCSWYRLRQIERGVV